MLLLVHGIALGHDYADTFLRISPDAISRSTGGANAAYSVGAADIFSNPALLGRHTLNELQLSSIVHSDFVQYTNGAFAMPLSRDDHIGIGLLWNNIPDAQELDQTGVAEGVFDNSQLAVIAGYSRVLASLSIGAHVKYLRFGFSAGEVDNTANAMSFDLGLHYQLREKLKFGIVYKKGFDVNWNKDRRDSVPRYIGLGMSWEPILFAKDFLRVLVALDQMEGEPVQMNLGLMVALSTRTAGFKGISIRAGYGKFDLGSRKETGAFEKLTEWERDFTVGAGLNLGPAQGWGLGLDYCFQIEESLDNQHIITTRISF